MAFPTAGLGHQGLMHESLSYWAARTPDEVAIEWQATTVTYRELDARADRVAHALIAAGVDRDAVVGVCLRRTPTLISTLFGVLRSGRCYLPLDPGYPAERLSMMLADSGAALVVVEPGFDPAVLAGVEVADIDDFQSRPVAAGSGPLPRPAPADAAYIISTSGSTGRPKGVVIEHRSARALLAWAVATFGDDLARTLAATSVCFDLSVFEIFGTLAAGGRLILVRDALELADLDPAVDVRLVNTVPSAMAELLAADAVPRTVRTVCLAGERFPAALAAALWRRPHIARVCNLYGPSEDTTYSTWAELRPGDPHEPSIGRPLPGTAAYVLDEALRPVGPGEPGELFLAGDGLARGYQGRPRETAASFLPDPYSAEPGRRMYRTGDRVRWRDEGLAYIGRTDDQVKVRGYRIELGDVSAALHSAPGVRTAAATVVAGPSGEPRLAGYLVAETTGAGDTAAVREYLRGVLPPALVPTMIIWQESLPTTPSGKIDRAALPAPRFDNEPVP